MLVASLLWYRKLRKDLEEIGFKFNEYDGCVANRLVNSLQQTVRFHVDDILCSHKEKRVNSDFHRWCDEKYGKLKPVKVKRGNVHEFLGMTLDFGSHPGSVHVKQESHIEDMLESFNEKLKGKALTPARNDLFMAGAGRLLCEHKKELLHSIVAKRIFVGKRSCPDVMATVLVLSGRV